MLMCLFENKVEHTSGEYESAVSCDDAFTDWYCSGLLFRGQTDYHEIVSDNQSAGLMDYYLTVFLTYSFP